MQTAKHPGVPLLLLLLGWANHRIAQFMASLKPRYGTEEIAALVAGGGNPTGA